MSVDQQTGGRPALTCTHWCILRGHLLQCEVCMFSFLLSWFTWSRTGYSNLKKLRTYEKQGLMIKRDEQQQITCWNIWYYWYSEKSGSQCVLEQEKKKDNVYLTLQIVPTQFSRNIAICDFSLSHSSRIKSFYAFTIFNTTKRREAYSTSYQSIILGKHSRWINNKKLQCFCP